MIQVLITLKNNILGYFQYSLFIGEASSEHHRSLEECLTISLVMGILCFARSRAWVEAWSLLLMPKRLQGAEAVPRAMLQEYSGWDPSSIGFPDCSAH